MARQVKKQTPKTKQKATPSAADFLQQPAVDPVKETNSAPSGPLTPPIHPTSTPAVEQPKTEQKTVQNVRETIETPVVKDRIHSGDPCGSRKKCPGKYRVLSSIREKNRRTRYLACSICNFKPKNNKEVTYIP